MFKVLKYSAIIFIVLISAIQTSFATSFSDTIDFSYTQGSKSYTYLEISDTYSFTHTLTGLNSSSFTLEDASLSLLHMDNSNSNIDQPYELWYADSVDNILIGQLKTSIGDWELDTWILSQDVLNEMAGTDPWSLTVKLSENTNGTDKLKIDYSTLSGNYSLLEVNPPADDPPPSIIPSQPIAVPEPGTLLLLGAGLAGAGLLRKGINK